MQNKKKNMMKKKIKKRQKEVEAHHQPNSFVACVSKKSSS